MAKPQRSTVTTLIVAGTRITFVPTYNADQSALRSHVPRAKGTWQVVNREACIGWSDGWRDITRRDGDGFRKIAIGPGKGFGARTFNTDTADRGELPAHRCVIP